VLTEEEDTGEAHLYGFTNGTLYDLSVVAGVTAKSKIIPYFSPAEHTQVIIMYPEKNCIRIFDHHVDEQGLVVLKRVKKIVDLKMSERMDMNTVHTAVSNAENELLIFVDKKDMHIYDLRDLTLDRESGGYLVQKAHTKKDLNI
jgi:hypothetical protein